ncbi:hypothetical protein DPMN_096588 [Dreissena polymorpha]|uniref:Uncharacterized protein n=1 Tax=Dreissena polymorpha TaxID=45954 RepID=A0A9D4LA09_DREPO|nr:hypothetical protein DPMN_096588 [Dreissena polymorpha]
MAFISVMLMVDLSETTKPVCFRFNYEEKLLEKMVKNEFKMEQALKRIDDIEGLMLRTNRTIQGALGTFKASTTIMIPAKKTCYNGWELKYRGILIPGRDSHPNAQAAQRSCDIQMGRLSKFCSRRVEH